MGKFDPEKIYGRLVSIASKGIGKIKPRLLRIGFSGGDDSSLFLSTVPGLTPTTYWNHPRYRRTYVKWMPTYFVKAFCVPISKYDSTCLVEFCPRETLSLPYFKNALIHLDKRVPLKLSRVEYGVNLFCDSPEKVERLFQAIIQNLFVPCYEGTTTKLWKNLVIQGDIYRYNRYHRIGGVRRVWERGPDKKREQYKYWPYRTLDRVRLQYTAKGTVLRKRGLDGLEDLIADPQFPSIIAGKWRFKQFTSDRLPKPWEYKTKGSDGQCFLPIYHIARKHIPNICKFTEPIPEFSVLQKRIMKEATRFNERWKSC